MIPAVAFLLLGTLYDQSIEKLIDRQFPAPSLSYILLDTASGTVIAQRWEHANRPIPAGSLVKPFVALAASSNAVFTCNPKECWLPKGHGTIGLTSAIAHSCNSYFLQLAPKANPDFLGRFGLQPPPQNASPETWIGLGREWMLSSLSLARAYCMLASYPEAEPIRAGMLQSSQSGTGRAIGRKALVKTGTAACSHPAGQPGDGYVVAISHSYTLLVQMHGVPGATVAATAGQMLTAILHGK
ncbi:MAG: penicillin-binding transpeptidase domain-containing protein [Bryobacteraceae bacterium]